MSKVSPVQDFYRGKSIVLTGAASGLGRALALRLVAHGATVHALDSNEEGLLALERETVDPGGLHSHVLDVRDLEAYRRVVHGILSRTPGVDFLFNNAGVTLLGEAQKIPFERHKWLLDINLMGVIHGTLLIYPAMIARRSGWIVNTASIAGSTGYATATAYTASKAAILEFSRSLRAECKGYGVNVSVACPGYVDSGIFSQDRIHGARRDAVIRDLPVKMMSPDEAAGHLLAGLAIGRETIVFPLSARILWGLSKWAPSLINPFQRRLLKVFRSD